MSGAASPALDWPGRARLALGAALIGAMLPVAVAASHYLSAPDSSVGATVVTGRVEAGPRRGGTALFARDGRRWIGDGADLPPGSVIHVQPSGFPGFFVLRGAGGAVWAVSDRNPHRGQPLWWQDPFPVREFGGVGPSNGFASWDGDFTAEGDVLWGPPPRPLDRFPASIVDGRIVVAVAPCERVLDFSPSWVAGCPAVMDQRGRPIG